MPLGHAPWHNVCPQSGWYGGSDLILELPTLFLHLLKAMLKGVPTNENLRTY